MIEDELHAPALMIPGILHIPRRQAAATSSSGDRFRRGRSRLPLPGNVAYICQCAAQGTSEPMHTIEISDEAYEAAKRTAALDSIDVSTLVESLVRRHAEYIDLFQEASPEMPPFSLEHYEMDRVPGVSEEDYQDRLRMFTSL
jgi:predicted CopG family antitoxin